jgi:PAS domain-containing protein
MRILVITPEPRWADAVRAVFPQEDVIPGNPQQIGTLRAMLSVAEACFIGEAKMGALTFDTLKQVSALSSVPLFALGDNIPPEAEEAALVAGARQVFRTPLRPGMVQLAVARAQQSTGASLTRIAIGKPVTAPMPPATVSPRAGGELGRFREFSRLLAHAAGDPRFITAYLASLRDVLGCTRVVLYRNAPQERATVLEVAASAGVDLRQFESFRLYREHGLGRLVTTRGAVVVRERLRSDDQDESVAAREMAVFSAELAVPVIGADGGAGLLLIGSRISGGGYADAELTDIFYAMEALAGLIGSPVDRRAPPPPESIFPAVLEAMPIGCAMLDANLRIIGANEAFRAQLGRESANPLGIERLPTAWADAIAAIVQGRSNATDVELDHELSGVNRRVRVNLRPFGAGSTDTWLMITQDVTEQMRMREQIHDLSMHNVLQRAGEQLSNEFRNALTPIEILVQLSGETPNARRDIDRLRTPVSLAIHRLRRRIDNLGYLTKTSIVPELTTVSAVFRAARERLDHWIEPKQLKTLVWSGEFSKVAFTADAAAVGLALAELIVNAIEAAGGRQVTVTAEDLPEAVNFKIRNPGDWSPPAESSGFGHRPFVTAKSTGVGLGVEVATRVAEFHGGRLVLGPISPDVVEAILRVPRNLPVVPSIPFETAVAKTW